MRTLWKDRRIGESSRTDGFIKHSNIWGRRGDFIGRWYGTYLIAGSADWTDYTLSVRVKPSDDDGFGVVFRYQDAEHFYRLLFLQDGMSGGPITRLDKREGADYTELWSEPKGYRPRREMMIEIDVRWRCDQRFGGWKAVVRGEGRFVQPRQNRAVLLCAEGPGV